MRDELDFADALQLTPLRLANALHSLMTGSPNAPQIADIPLIRP